MAFVGYLRLNPEEMIGIASTATTLDGRYLEDSRKIKPLGDGVVVAVVGNEDLGGRILKEMRPKFLGVPYQRMVEGLTAAASDRLSKFFEDAYLMPQHGITFDDYVAIKETGRRKDGTPFEGNPDVLVETDRRFRSQAYRLFVGGADNGDVSLRVVFPDGGTQEASYYWFLGHAEKESTVRLGDKLTETRIQGQGPIPYPVGVRLLLETLREEYWRHRDAETGTQLVHVRRGQPVEDVDWIAVVLLHNVLTFHGRGYLPSEERDRIFEALLDYSAIDELLEESESQRGDEGIAEMLGVDSIALRVLERTKSRVKELVGARDQDVVAKALDDDRLILIR